MNNNETYHRSLFQNNRSVMLLIRSETSEVADCNLAVCSFYGYTYNEMLQLKITDLNILTKVQVNKEMNLAKEKVLNRKLPALVIPRS